MLPDVHRVSFLGGLFSVEGEHLVPLAIMCYAKGELSL